MKQAQLGTSLNMFGGAKGGEPNKMDASSVMGGSSSMMGGANAVMNTGLGSGGGSSSGTQINPMNMMGSMGGGSGSQNFNPMNMMTSMGGSGTGTSRDASMYICLCLVYQCRGADTKINEEEGEGPIQKFKRG